jgi:hypothetical protein
VSAAGERVLFEAMWSLCCLCHGRSKKKDVVVGCDADSSSESVCVSKDDLADSQSP